MSKLETTAIIANIINLIVCFHVILTCWVDRNPVPLYYFYLISLGLIINGIGAFVTTSRTSTK